MKTHLWQLAHTFLVVALLFHAGRPATAGEKVDLSLASALDRARKQNPQIAIARERVQQSEGMRVQASLIPNPSLYATSENTPLGGSQPFTFGNDTDDYIYVIQKIELGGKRERRIAFASENLNQTSIQSELAMRQLLARIAYAYWTAAGSATIDKLYHREVGTLGSIVEYSQARAEKGAARQADVIRIQLESDRLEAQARLATEQARRALIALYREMGATDFPDSVEFTDRLNDLPEIQIPDIRIIFEDRPEMRSVQEGLKQALANLNLQRAKAVPDPELMGGYKRFSGSGQFTGQNTLFFGFQVPLPIFDRNQGTIAAAQAQVRGAKDAIRDEEITIRAEVAAASSDYALRRGALLGLLPRMLGRAAETQEIAGGAYRLGGADILRFLDASRIDIETKALFVQTLIDYHESVVNLQLATGMLR